MTQNRETTGLLDAGWCFWTGLLAATVIGAVVRLAGLESPSFWVDEFFTIGRAGRDPVDWIRLLGYLPSRATLWMQGAELSQVGIDNITEWKRLGVTEWGARLGPCLIGVLSIPILGLTSRRVVGSGAAMVAALILALSPWHIYWSQMARYYTTQFLLANLFLLWFASGATTGSKRVLICAVIAAVLAFLSHPTAAVIVGICAGSVVLAWILRPPEIVLWPATAALGATIAGFFFLYLLAEVFTGNMGGDTVAFAQQDWDPSLKVLVLGTARRIDLVVTAVAVLAALALIRARNPVGTLLAAVAILTPAAFLGLSPWFPIGPRYYLSSLLSWTLLAGLWAAEIDRRLSTTWGRLAGMSGAAALLASVSFGVYLYSLEGAGARARWREAFEFVQRYADANDQVFSRPGSFQAQYYLGRELSAFPTTSAEVAALDPGTWILFESRGARPPAYAHLLEVEVSYGIPGKPWSWVVHVMRVPAP